MWAYVVKGVSAAWLLVLFTLAMYYQESLPQLAQVSGSGCAWIHAPIGKLPGFVNVSRWPQIGCVMCYEMLLWLNLLAIVFVMPYSNVRWLTRAGSRTLSGYLFMQCSYVAVAFIIRIIGFWTRNLLMFGGVPHYRIGDAWAMISFLLFAPLTVAFLCSETFHKCVAEPLVAPTWALKILSPSTYEGGGWRFTWSWFFSFIGFGFLIMTIASINVHDLVRREGPVSLDHIFSASHP